MRTIRVICECLLTLVLVASSAVHTTQPPSKSAVTYAYGHGTYYVATRRAELGKPVGRNWGNAKTWYAQAQAAGHSVGSKPQKGAIAWTASGPYGQVAIVESVSADGTQVTISEMNGKSGWNRVTTRTTPASWWKYIY